MTNTPNNKARIGLARKTARKLLKAAKITKPPILLKDVVKHLNNTMNISVLPWNCGNKIDGILIPEETDATIGYNHSQHVHRQRFTVAHEIGHLLLEHISTTSKYDLKSNKIEEVEANQFAAELLMPLAIFKADFERNSTNVQALANLYNVSLAAAWWHIYNCKLL